MWFSNNFGHSVLFLFPSSLLEHLHLQINATLCCICFERAQTQFEIRREHIFKSMF